MRRLLLLLTLLPLSSCSSVSAEGEQLICILGCIHTRVKAKKEPAEAGLKTEEAKKAGDTEENRGPEKDNGQQKQVRPQG